MQPQHIAELILSGFRNHYKLFQAITAKAPLAFAHRDWQKINEISKLRISHYDDRVNETIAKLKSLNEQQIITLDQTCWLETKQLYQQFLRFHPQAELAETFYNSVIGRLFKHR